MKRRVVQHGPSTLTISLPAEWVRSRGLEKGDEVTVLPCRNDLLITTERSRQRETRRISVKGLPLVITKAIAALYKHGCDEIIVEYGDAEELERIHSILDIGFIGFEVVEESKSHVRIRTVSEPEEEEFKTLFRRIFYFLLSIAEDTREAMKHHGKQSYEKLILRDESVNKLADFCRRVVNKSGQRTYRSDTALYHVIEQLEKIGDDYKELNRQMLGKRKPCSPELLAFLARVNALLKSFESLFFGFSLEKVEAFYREYETISGEVRRLAVALPKDEHAQLFLCESIARELKNLTGATMTLFL